MYLLTAPPRVKVDSASELVELGDFVVLNCTVTGVPQPSMKWLKDNNQPLVLGEWYI